MVSGRTVWRTRWKMVERGLHKSLPECIFADMTRFLFYALIVLFFIFFAVLVWGCSSSTETRIEDKTLHIPERVVHDTLRMPIFSGQPTPCDTGAILEAKCRGEISNIVGGVDYRTKWWVEKKRSTKLTDSLGNVLGDFLEYQTTADITIRVLKDSLRYRDSTEVHTTQEYGFWDKIGLGLTWIAGFVVVVGLAYIGLNFKSLLTRLF